MATDIFRAVTISPSGGPPFREQTLVGAVASSSSPGPGSPDAFKILLLDADGQIDPSVISGGGSTAFSAITGSTNTTAAMVVGSGASLTAAGTGIISANAVFGVAVSTAPTAGQVLTATSGTTADWQTPSSGTSVFVNGSPVADPNFGNLPAAPGTNTLVTWQFSGADVSAYAQLALTFSPVGGEFLTGYDAGTGAFSASAPSYPVTSVFGRTGAVVAATGDYTYAQISGTPQLAQTFTGVASEWLNSYNAATGLFTATQPAFSDISGTVSTGQLSGTYGISVTGTASTITGTITYAQVTGVPVTSFAATIGDGVSTAYTVTHGLNTEDIVVQVHNISTGEMEVVDVDIVSTTQITVTFGAAPSSNSERVVVLSSGGTGSGGGSSSGALTLLEQHTASGSATLDFTTAISSTYDDYVIEVLNLQPAVDSATFLVQLSTDGGATWDTSSANYVGGSHYTRMDSAGSGDNSGETSFAGAYLTNAYGTANPGVSARVSFFNSASAVWRQFIYQTNGIGSGNNGYYTQTGGAIWKSTSQANALRFYFDSGNITSGVIRVYGVSKTSSGGGSSGGGGIYPTMTPPVSTNFTWQNPSSFPETTTDWPTKMLVVFPTAATGLWLVQNAALPATPYTIDLGAMIFAANNINVVNILLSNGGLTNARAFGSRVNSGAGEYGAWYVTDQSWTGPVSPGAENAPSPFTADGMSASQHIVFVRVTNDGTNVNVYWSANGENYILLETVTVGSLGFTPASTGIVFYNNANPMNVWCYHWAVSGSILPQNS